MNLNVVKFLAIGSLVSFFLITGVPVISKKFEKDCSVLLDCLKEGRDCNEIKKMYKSCLDKSKIRKYKQEIKKNNEIKNE